MAAASVSYEAGRTVSVAAVRTALSTALLHRGVPHISSRRMWSAERRRTDGREVRHEEEAGAMAVPLVVGIDGSEASLEAVEWAADEAARPERRTLATR